jgi:hypothetical protein
MAGFERYISLMYRCGAGEGGDQEEEHSPWQKDPTTTGTLNVIRMERYLLEMRQRSAFLEQTTDDEQDIVCEDENGRDDPRLRPIGYGHGHLKHGPCCDVLHRPSRNFNIS